MIPTSAPNSEQRRWREAVRGLGSILGPSRHAIEIHHCAGRTARHNKVDIGHWWILPLTSQEHGMLHGDMGRFEIEALEFNPVGRWDCEKFLFHKVLMSLDGTLEPPYEVIQAIMDYRK